MHDTEGREQSKETIALIKIIALGNRQMEASQLQTAADAIAKFRGRRS